MTNTCLKLMPEINYNIPVKDLTIKDIKLIKEKDLQQAVFHIYTFFEPIKGGNLLFNYQDMSWYSGFDSKKITINNLKDLIDGKYTRFNKTNPSKSKKESLHYSLSSFYGYKRSYDTAFGNSGFTIDLDYYETEYKGLGPYELVKIMREEGAFEMLEPDYVICSGNGINLVYLLKNINVNGSMSKIGSYKIQSNIEKRRSIVKALIKNFEKYGGDKKCHDITRINKMPGGINYKTGNPVFILDFDKVISKTFKGRTLGHLYNHFMNKGYITIEKEKKHPKKSIKTFKEGFKPKEGTKGMKVYRAPHNIDNIKEVREYNVKVDGVINLRNSHSLNISRLEDLDFLLISREYKFFESHIRNAYLHIYSVYLRKGTKDLDFIYEKILDINNSYDVPIKNIDYLKRQILDDKINYNYNNDSIIENLKITYEEMKNLKTIINKTEKYRRKNIKRNNKRRNANGLTKREQQRENNINSIKKLLDQGYKQKDIAKKLNLAKSTVSGYIKEIKDT